MNDAINYEEQVYFKEWLGLNLNSISWEGRYLDDFNKTWTIIFPANISITEQFSLLTRLEGSLQQGPIIAWLKWIKFKFVCYVFVYKDFSIREIAQHSGLEEAEVSLVLRNFFVERFPFLEDKLNLRFQIGNILSDNSHLKFSKLENDLAIKSELSGSLDNEVMRDLEVTLYSDWNKLVELLAAEDLSSVGNLESALKDKRFLNRQIKFFFELIFLFVIGGLLIFVIKVGNKAYEDYLVKKITLFSPNFFWLDKSLSFKDNSIVKEGELDIKLDELEALEKLENKASFENIEQTARYEVESDVVLTSVDTLPKDFEVADLEQSGYEEFRKGGYRNSRYGRRKAYRVMMTAVDPSLVKEDVLKVINRYQVKQVDNVKPGTRIPGGIYFNLYVPRKKLKGFLSDVSAFEDKATILESKTVFGGPPNTNKVFIWIKSI